MKKFIALALVAATVAAPAMAQTFAGPRIEGHLGFDSADLHANGAQASGLAYGGGVGYDFVLSPKVRLGVEGSFDSSTTDKKFAGLLNADAKRDIEAGARLGYVVSPNTLLYVKGAWTDQRVGYSLDTNTGKVGLGHDVSQGWRAGAGAEVALTEHLFVKAEYRYSDYGQGDHRNQVISGVGVRF